MTEQSTTPHPALGGSGEAALLRRLRDGEDAAFGELFEAHAAAVRRLALGLASDRSEAEDITAETFFRVLQALRRGSGPRDSVRAYLLTVARRVSWEWSGARRDVPVSEDELSTRVGAGSDAHARTAEHTLITRAFTSLPERWRTVLWQTEVEGEQPAVVAPHFGLSANATAALARRARQGLRAAYLQAHLSVHRGADGCRAVVEKLGGYTAGSVTGAEARRIRAHLMGCSSCRATADELREVCSSLRAHAGVLAVLVPVAEVATKGGLSSAVSSLFAGLKSLVVGSKVKVGIAVASTAAAGAFGAAVGPIVFDTEATVPLGLPSHNGGTELTVALTPPRPPEPPAPAEPVVATGHLYGQALDAVVPRQRDGGRLPAERGVTLPSEASGVASVPGESPQPTAPRETPEEGTPRIDPSEGVGTTSETEPMTSEVPETMPTTESTTDPTSTSSPESPTESCPTTTVRTPC
ncbi:sigma-70 family RNA polymerase sigma factor [Amycolatopsis suaedae]|uniref:Sigma-70 family RNA polymerase sigma factor n=1 Tax=Amycolatopsis suaedae TaxID=2510978 RepID=A0A4Q7J5J6_9PSEU|nr:sigma-70 family RNA polymerase sigma factor [Amycolatopsis suaedae]RZQ62128.1 sigma-70 family RNA polymerase sigma factor [Amycolatopsis suaedae]